MFYDIVAKWGVPDPSDFYNVNVLRYSCENKCGASREHSTHFATISQNIYVINLGVTYVRTDELTDGRTDGRKPEQPPGDPPNAHVPETFFQSVRWPPALFEQRTWILALKPWNAPFSTRVL